MQRLAVRAAGVDVVNTVSEAVFAVRFGWGLLHCAGAPVEIHT